MTIIICFFLDVDNIDQYCLKLTNHKIIYYKKLRKNEFIIHNKSDGDSSTSGTSGNKI